MSISNVLQDHLKLQKTNTELPRTEESTNQYKNDSKTKRKDLTAGCCRKTCCWGKPNACTLTCEGLHACSHIGVHPSNILVFLFSHGVHQGSFKSIDVMRFQICNLNTQYESEERMQLNNAQDSRNMQRPVLQSPR